MPTVEHHYAQLSDLKMHYVTAGQGKPLVLLHGYPQSWYCWREVIELLKDDYYIIAPDLRGLGDSTRPWSGYDKKTIAADIWELVTEHLGIERFAVAGHDWGGTVAFALAADHQDAVTHLAVVDVAIPGDGQANIGQAGRRWHHTFLQTPDLPEALIEGREHHYFGWFFTNYGYRPDCIAPDAVTEYLRTNTTPGALRAGFAYYRMVGQDVKDNEARGAKITVPSLAVGGANGWGRGPEVGKSLRMMAETVDELIIDECGHWVPEEQPETLAKAFKDFFG
ncbi:alpha/beta hydrolase [Burkholderia sp. RS01]|uniref:alpha/beta fold hydrolase n=1 Tax=unclassified Burkholderia TaxID=2613784 RepID=UPI003218B239